VSHLAGDFTFIVWDAPRRRLFGVRDQLGVKPFFYAQVGSTVVVSNTLECLRAHPAVSRELHEPAIADFLLFGLNQDSSTTSFRDIRRLPPAHTITWTADAAERRRYWTLPIDEPIHFRRRDDYADRFTELLRTALRDRLRTRRIGVFMSGGLDSPTLAATALGVLREQAADFHLHAITSVYDRLVPDEERYYAGLVADHLQIPIRYDVRDDERSLAEWNEIAIDTPEPVENPPAVAAGVAFMQQMATDARLFLYGEGPDNALRYEWRPYLAYLIAKRRVARLVGAVASDLAMHRRLPLWSSLRQMVGTGRAARLQEPWPLWLNQDFAARCDCRARWDAGRNTAIAAQAPAHPLRPQGYRGFNDVRWQALFEDCDLTAARSRTEIRHPFLDLRLLRYLLAVPAMPWCRNKLLIRRAMRTTLPRTILRRRKTSLAASPDFERVKASGFPHVEPCPDLATYVNASRIPAVPASDVEMRAALRPLGLNAWLHQVARH
jgi:asparagine synthase (glutamine-hydrolysing)